MMIITNDFLVHFLHIAAEVLPVFSIAILAAALIDEFLPENFIENYFSKSHILAILNASLIGALVPICTCGMIPLAFKLLKKGLHWKIMTAFLLAGAACSLPALGMTMVLGIKVTAFRFAVAIIFGVLVTYILAAFAPKDFVLELKGAPAHHCCHKKESRLKRITSDLWMMLKDFLPWILLAAFIATYFHFNFGALSELALISNLQNTKLLGPLLASIIGFPFYFCAGADVPISRELLMNGVPLGTVLAFMTVSPGINFTSFVVYKQCIGFKKALILTLTAMLSASLIASLINFI